MFFGLFNKWESSVKKLRENALSVQAFVNANESKTLYYSTPFIDDENGGVPNALQKQDSDIAYFPAFTTVEGLREHMMKLGWPQHIAIKGNLKTVLSSLGSHPMLSEWGVVVDPATPLAVEIPPQVRVQPKCLR